MSRHKLRVGKNGRGWFVAIPRSYGGFDVIEDVGSFESAWALATHLIYHWAVLR